MTPRQYFEHQLRAFAHGDRMEWTIGIVRPPVALLLASEGMAQWNRHYHAMGYGPDDPVFAHGRAGGRPIALRDIPHSTPRAKKIAADRKAHGLRRGFLVPIISAEHAGSFATVFGLRDAVLDAVGPEALSLEALIHWYSEFGDFGAASRFHLGGATLAPAVAATCRVLLAGASAEEAATARGISRKTVYGHLGDARDALISLGLWPDDAPPRAAPRIAWEAGLFDLCEQDN